MESQSTSDADLYMLFRQFLSAIPLKLSFHMKCFLQWIQWWHQYNASQVLFSLINYQISNLASAILVLVPEFERNRLEDEEIGCEVLNCRK